MPGKIKGKDKGIGKKTGSMKKKAKDPGEDAIKKIEAMHKKATQDILDKKRLILTVEVMDIKGAEWIMQQMFSKDCKPIEGLKITTMAWDCHVVSASELDDVIKRVNNLKR